MYYIVDRAHLFKILRFCCCFFCSNCKLQFVIHCTIYQISTHIQNAITNDRRDNIEPAIGLLLVLILLKILKILI